MPEKTINQREQLSRTTGRTLEFYRQFLMFSANELSDKRILNLGAGKSNLNAELEAAGVKPKLLVNVDFAHRNLGRTPTVADVISEKIFSRDEIPPNAVVADIKNLPFSGDSFDVVLYLWSLTVLNQKDKIQSVKEAFRTAKIQGIIKIYPVSYNKKVEAVIQRYPFLCLNKPKLDAGKLASAGLAQKHSALGKTRQFIFNLEALPIDLAEKCLAAISGKQVGALTITKPKNLTEAEFGDAIKELESAGCIL